MFWLGVIVSLCYVPGVTGAFIASQWPVLSILLPLGLWRHGPFTLLHAAGLLFIAYATVRLWYGPDFNGGVYGLWLVYIMGLSFWLGTTLDDLRGLYAGLAAGGAVSSGVTVLQAFGYDIVAHVTSAAGLYVNSVAQGMVLALVIVALASERMWLWVPPLVPGLVLSHSRGAWLALAVGTVGCYVRRTWLLAFVIVVGAAFFFAATFDSSDGLRLFIWKTAASSLTWWGWGPGSFYNAVFAYNGHAFFPEYAHNDALQIAFEYGIVAALPIGVLAFAFFRTDAREWPVILAFVTAGCYSMPLWVPVASFLGLVAAGRVVRVWALHGPDGDACRFDFVPQLPFTRHGRHGVRNQTVSLEPGS